MAITRIDHLQVNRLDVQETVVSGGTTFVDLANAATDEKAKVSVTDTTPGFLQGKLVAGTNITLTRGNAGANETLTVAATVPVVSVAGKTGAVTLTNTDVGAAAASHTHSASDVTSGVFSTARLASSGTANSTTFLRGDQTWAAIGGGLSGTSYVYVAADGTAVQNGTALIAAYNTAKTKSPSASNIITVIAAPGNYDLGASTLTLDTNYINLVSLDGNRSVILTSTATDGINVTANNVFIKGLDLGTGIANRFTIATNLSGLRVVNCRAGYYSFGSRSDLWSETGSITVSGTFIDCDAGQYSFGSVGNQGNIATASGTFINCSVDGIGAFGYCNRSTASGGAVASGLFISCNSNIVNPVGCWNQFGHQKSALQEGTGFFTGTAISCQAGQNSFGAGDRNEFSGTAKYCLGGSGSFGLGSMGNAKLTGKLMYCQLSSGTFQTVSSGGRTYYCIDGNGAVNNQ